MELCWRHFLAWMAVCLLQLTRWLDWLLWRLWFSKQHLSFSYFILVLYWSEFLLILWVLSLYGTRNMMVWIWRWIYSFSFLWSMASHYFWSVQHVPQYFFLQYRWLLFRILVQYVLRRLQYLLRLFWKPVSWRCLYKSFLAYLKWNWFLNKHLRTK